MRKEQTFLYINEVRRNVSYVNGEVENDRATVHAQLIWYPEGDETDESYIFGKIPLVFPALGIFANVEPGQQFDFVPRTSEE